MSKKVRALSITAIILAVICVFAGLFSGCSGSDNDEAGFPAATDKFFINDFADVVSDTAEEEIYSRGVALQNKTTAQAVVVTLDTVGDYEMWEYALELGREWGVGAEKEDNGIVILLAVSDREVLRPGGSDARQQDRQNIG